MILDRVLLGVSDFDQLSFRAYDKVRLNPGESVMGLIFLIVILILLFGGGGFYVGGGRGGFGGLGTILVIILILFLLGVIH